MYNSNSDASENPDLSAKTGHINFRFAKKHYKKLLHNHVIAKFIVSIQVEFSPHIAILKSQNIEIFNF